MSCGGFAKRGYARAMTAISTESIALTTQPRLLVIIFKHSRYPACYCVKYLPNMSFGFAVGDFLAVGQLCWKVYRKCKDAAGNYAELSGEVSALYAIIKENEEILSQQDLTSQQRAGLTECRDGCESVLIISMDF